MPKTPTRAPRPVTSAGESASSKTARAAAPRAAAARKASRSDREEFSLDDRVEADRAALLAWYRAQKRDLPWRRDRDPYRIWISEAMLQQTTVTAVIPYYKRFLERFPDLGALASAPVEDVLEAWAGLGYYSRARNLHRSAQALVAAGGEFPRDYRKLMEMPGFGPYTARAVASLAFDQKVGVLDGNVIRTLSRRYGLAVEWWRPAGRDRLQSLADRLAQVDSPHDWNQGMMELGATVCTPAKPACLLCPWAAGCRARLEDLTDTLPLKKPRRDREIWRWTPSIVEREGAFALVKNDYAPFLKGHWIWPGRAERAAQAPRDFHYRASVTHHDIFVVVESANELPSAAKPLGSREGGGEAKVAWVPRQDLARWVPASLVAKALSVVERGESTKERECP